MAEGCYLLRSNLTDVDAATLWKRYIQLTEAELELRSLKSSMKMEHLRCRTPAMIRKELWAHLLAYNLTRKVIAQAAQRTDKSPRQISFVGAMQNLAAGASDLPLASPVRRTELARTLLRHIPAQKIGHRPGRVEPRAIKRRPKPQALLTQPRAQAKAQLQAG